MSGHAATHAMTPAAAIKATDFPDWVNPMLVKELRQGLRGRGFMAVFLWVQLSMTGLVSYQMLHAAEPASYMRSAILNSLYILNLTLILHVLIPFRHLFIRDEDAVPENLDLLKITRLASWRIAWSKVVAGLALVLLAVTALLPHVLLRYHLGGVNVIAELVIMGWMLVGSFVCICWGVMLGLAPVAVRVIVGLLVIFVGLPLLEGALWYSIRAVGMMSSTAAEVVTLWVIFGGIAVVIPLAIVEARFGQQHHHQYPVLPPSGTPPSS